MRAADRASPWWYGAGLLAMALVCDGVLFVRPAANASRWALRSATQSFHQEWLTTEALKLVLQLCYNLIAPILHGFIGDNHVGRRSRAQTW
jgi:hypothetical protein